MGCAGESSESCFVKQMSKKIPPKCKVREASFAAQTGLAFGALGKKLRIISIYKSAIVLQSFDLISA